MSVGRSIDSKYCNIGQNPLPIFLVRSNSDPIVDHTNKNQEFVPDSSNRAEPFPEKSGYFNSCFNFAETVGAVHPDRIWTID